MSLLIIHPRGGLCNRLQTIASAKVLADSLKREFRVDWVSSENECNCHIHDLFQGIPTVDGNVLDSTRSLHYNVFNSSQIPEVEAQTDVTKNLHLHSAAEFKPSAMPDGEFVARFQQALQALTPVAEVEQRVLPDVSHMIGLQIRRKDHWRATRYSPLSLFVRVMDRYVKEEPTIRFFLCSDSSFVKEYLKERYGNTLFFYENADNSRNTAAGIQAALLDLLSLSRTMSIYKSYSSSFGKVAHQFHNTPLKTLYTKYPPRRWDAYPWDRATDRSLHWNAQIERWEKNNVERHEFLKRLQTSAFFLRCRFFSSKFYQLYASRYLP